MSVHFTVGKMCEEQESKYDIQFTKQVISVINEIVWNQIRQAAQDLESFAKYEIYFLACEGGLFVLFESFFFIQAWEAHNHQY